MSRLDNFLLSNGLIEYWSVNDERVGNRDISDHCPITPNSGKVNWGLKLFYFNNTWFKHDSFIPFIQEEWLEI